MKKQILVFGFFTLLLTSCSSTKSSNSTNIKEYKPVKVEETTTPSEVTSAQIAAGRVLFYEKSCTACHAEEKKIIGSSVKQITQIYTEQNGNLLNYLKGNADAIVDTDPGLVAIMQANLDAIVKDISQDELKAIVAYMYSIK